MTTTRAKTIIGVLGVTTPIVITLGVRKVIRIATEHFKRVSVADVVVNGHVCNDQVAESFVEEHIEVNSMQEVRRSEGVIAPTDRVQMHDGNVVYSISLPIVENHRVVPQRLLGLYTNRVLLEVKCKLGDLPNDALHRRIIKRTANAICLAHNLRVVQRHVVVTYVAALYHEKSVTDEEAAQAQVAYHRRNWGLYRLLRKWLT